MTQAKAAPRKRIIFHWAVPRFLESPWFLLAFFALLNAWVSWGPGSLASRVGILLFLVSPLMFWAFRNPASPDQKPLWAVEALPTPGKGVVVALFLLAAGIRLYRLTAVPVWPMIDEGMAGFLASHLNSQWHWNLLFSFDHVSPAFYWLLAFFFRIFPPSLFSLWLFPALVSVVTVACGYWACRTFFSKSFSFLYLVVGGFCFWPLYIGRFNEAASLLPLWEYLCFWLMGLCFQRRPSSAWAAGLALGVGFYITLNQGVFLALVVVLALLFFLPKSIRVKGSLHFFLCLFLPVVLLSIPLVIAHLQLPEENYLKRIWAFQPGFSWREYLQTTAAYGTALFWGVEGTIDYFGYQPIWGGFLNPLLGAVFWIGLAEMVRRRRHPLALGFFGASFLLFLPVFFTNNLEMFRIVTLLPLVLGIVALGFQALAKAALLPVRFLSLTIIFLISFGMDFYHLAVVYPRFWESHPELWDAYAKKRECFQAYQLLKDWQKTRGPGLVLTEFPVPLEQESREQSLVMACYPFDAGRNIRWKPEQARWAALLVEDSDLLFLHQRFPAAQWQKLGPVLYQFVPAHPHFYYLTLLPVTPENKRILMRWASANNFLEEMVYESLCPSSNHFRQEISSRMLQNYPLFQGDSFLESHFWTTLAENFQKDGQLEDSWQALKFGLQRGYPCPQKYYYMGFFLFKAKHYASAREAYLTAARLDRFFTPPREARAELDRLAQLEKNNVRTSSIGAEKTGE